MSVTRRVVQRPRVALALAGGILAGVCLSGCQTSPGDPNKNPYGAAPAGFKGGGPPPGSDYRTNMKGQTTGGGTTGTTAGPPAGSGAPMGSPYAGAPGGGPTAGPPGGSGGPMGSPYAGMPK